MNFTNIIFTIAISTYSVYTLAQDPTRFQDEIDEINSQYTEDLPDSPIIFAGSSSIRFWKDVDQLESDQPILNHGFGGSQMSDLNHYLNTLVLRFNPDKVFIYEGDNDIAEGKDTEEILNDTREVIERINMSSQDAEIYLLAAKPSISRWDLKDQYESLNQAFEELAKSTNGVVNYVDIWNPMLGEDGKVRSDIFIEDDLHMNEKGYAIWEKVIGPLVK